MWRPSVDPPAADVPVFKKRSLLPSSAEYKHAISVLELSVYALHRPFLKILSVCALDAPAAIAKKYVEAKRRQGRDEYPSMTEIEAWFFPTSSDDVDAVSILRVHCVWVCGNGDTRRWSGR